MKNAHHHKHWSNQMLDIYRCIIRRSVTCHLNLKEIVEYQIQLIPSAGGLGMRSPKHYYLASRISAVCNKLDTLQEYFRFDLQPKDQMHITNFDIFLTISSKTLNNVIK